MSSSEKKMAANTDAANHTKAAECCDKAADEHRNAAKCCKTGDHKKAEEHAKSAQDHTTQSQSSTSKRASA